MKLIIILFSLALIAYADDDRISFKDAYKKYMDLSGDYIDDEIKTCMKEKLDISSEKVNDEEAILLVIDLFENSCKFSADESRKSYGKDFYPFIKHLSRKEYIMIDVNCAKKRLQQLAPDDELVKDYIASDDNAKCDKFIKNDRNYLNFPIFRQESLKLLNIEECMEPVSAANIIEIWKMIIVALTEPANEAKLNELREIFVNMHMNQHGILLSCALKNFN